jgi:hypothetical protein
MPTLTVYPPLYFFGNTITVFRFPTIKESFLNREMTKQPSSSNVISSAWIRHSTLAAPSFVVAANCLINAFALALGCSVDYCAPTPVFPRDIPLDSRVE